MMKHLASLLLAAVFTGLPLTSTQAQTRLISEDEAKTPNMAVPTTRAITRGPGIRLVSPNEVSAKAFPFKVAFEPRGGAQIQPDSVRIEYLKQPLIDLTPRLAGALRGNLIELSAATVPPGSHPLRVSVRDSEGREAHTIIHLHAK